ncbi:MAG: penicillin-binding transpeptidase domain-containing protein, partial [Myxococcota bacterium]
NKVDQRMGFRRSGLETLGTDAAIKARRAEHETAMRDQNGFEADPAGRKGVPDKSILHPGRIYDAVVLEAQPKWVKVGIGAHEAIIPIGWSKWVYEPNPRKSWRRRVATDLTATVNGWEEDVEKGGTLVRKGDVVLVKVEAPSTAAGDADIKKAMSGTPAANTDMVAARLWQDPQVEASTMSFELGTGAVLGMVGGANFEKSEFNRVTQAKRQVGSTFKPIVYSAAVDTERLTAASIVPDIRGASYTTDAGFVWKPDNYGSDYMGDITMRQALALSKNTCTIKVLESMDPGMNRDSLYTFARKLGIGGPPSHTLPEDHITTPENDHLCPWVREKRDSTICMDRYPAKDPDLSNTAHRAQLGPDDVYWCRACDMSMGLGSASLTMEELPRAYTVFGTGGRLVQPYYIQKVEDRDGNVLEEHQVVEYPQVIRPEVATIGGWLLQNVVNSGTGAPARRALNMRFGGKTGTTQDYKDTWFVGFSNDVITGAWVGFDDPRSLGVSSTGGRTALPIWIDVMREAAPKSTDRPFKEFGDLTWVGIDEKRGTRVTSGGRNYPFIRGTVPPDSGVAAGAVSVKDFTEL